MKKSDSIQEISKALTDFRKEVKQPYKDADNPYYKSKFVPLENVIEAIDDVAPKNGLSFTQWALNDEKGRVGVATLLMHTSGEYIEYDPVFMNVEKNTPQGAGSLISYLKRYTLSAIFGITSDKDDDANQASKTQSKAKQQNNNAEVGMLKQEINDFISLMKSMDKKVTLQQVLEQYGIQNINTLSPAQAAAVTKKISAMAQKYKEGDK